jgi:hypothetical protein
LIKSLPKGIFVFQGPGSAELWNLPGFDVNAEQVLNFVDDDQTGGFIIRAEKLMRSMASISQENYHFEDSFPNAKKLTEMVSSSISLSTIFYVLLDACRTVAQDGSFPQTTAANACVDGYGISCEWLDSEAEAAPSRSSTLQTEVVNPAFPHLQLPPLGADLHSVAGDLMEVEVDLDKILADTDVPHDAAIYAWEPVSEEQYATVLYKLWTDINFVYCQQSAIVSDPGPR